MDTIMTGSAPRASAAHRAARFRAGKEPVLQIATRSPACTPARTYRSQTRAAMSGWQEVRLASKFPRVVVMAVKSVPRRPVENRSVSLSLHLLCRPDHGLIVALGDGPHAPKAPQAPGEQHQDHGQDQYARCPFPPPHRAPMSSMTAARMPVTAARASRVFPTPCFSISRIMIPGTMRPMTPTGKGSRPVATTARFNR